jgi:hypothetical protein
MSKISREVPKAIANFGEKQFKETGALTVEVLRVKEAVLRKHFRQLKGILYLVAVVSRDRVRVYFFNAAGMMVIGENLELSIYEDVRKSSRLVAKFEKPKELTPEELRIEATQELRDALGKAIRRVSRLLALKEPEFPDIFVTRSEKDRNDQSFGIKISEDREMMFEEGITTKSWSEGILLRAAFLLHFNNQQWSSEFVSSIGNGLALSLLKGEARTAWYNECKKRSKGGIWEPILNHMVRHSTTYSPKGYLWLSLLMGELPVDINFLKWKDAITTIHNSIIVPLGTEEHHIIDGFCKTLGNPQQLIKRRHVLESIHLSPRALCDPTPLGVGLSAVVREDQNNESWASIVYNEGSATKSLEILEGDDNTIHSIEYWLNLEDIFPLVGGPLSHGQSIIDHALEKIGIKGSLNKMYEATLELKERPILEPREIAVLERLVLGDLSILFNTFVGSPLAVRNLIEKGVLVLLPDFNHMGIDHDFLIKGSVEKVTIIVHLAPEATIFETDECAYAILSAPTSWNHPIIESARREDVSLWPIVSTRSIRRLLRFEDPYPSGEGPHSWTDTTT